MVTRELLGQDVFHWPEFQPLLARLGVSPKPSTRFVVTVAFDEVVTVQQTFQAEDANRPPAPRFQRKYEEILASLGIRKPVDAVGDVDACKVVVHG
jgi:hypothetical protein